MKQWFARVIAAGAIVLIAAASIGGFIHYTRRGEAATTEVFLRDLKALFAAPRDKPAARTALLPAPPAPAPAAAPSREHYYDFKEGIDYGYTAELSETQRQAGQAASNVIVVNYAGQRDGKYQIHMRQGTMLFAFECSVPCDVMKILSVLDADDLRQQVTVERVRPSPGMIAAMALRDAASGKLEEYVEYIDGDRKGRHVTLWVDERRGLTRTIVKKGQQR